MRKIRRVELTLFSLWLCPTAAVWAQKAVVIVPVADLRSDPAQPTPGVSDELQQSQLLFGEKVTVENSSGDWVQVQAVDQPSFKYHKQWQGYPGWVVRSTIRKTDETPALDMATAPKALPMEYRLGMAETLKEHASVAFSATHIVTDPWLPVFRTPKGSYATELPLGSYVQVLYSTRTWSEIDLLNGHTGWVPSSGLRNLAVPVPSGEVRDAIMATARLLIGDPYLWGGLTPEAPVKDLALAGIDCSGLVYITYRVQGIEVPRDSYEQYLKAEKIHRADLKPADLIFSAPKDQPEKITHVMLYAGGDNVIEAPRTGEEVRLITFKEKTGRTLDSVESGNALGDRVIYFGRFLHGTDPVHPH